MVVLVPPDPDGKIAAEDDEYDQADDLEGQTSNHDIDTGVNLVWGIASGCKPSSSSLEYKRKEIRNHENNGVDERPESGKVLPIYGDDASKAEVDGGAEKSRGDSQAADVDDEWPLRKDVVVHHDATDIADDFEYETEDGANREPPGAIKDAERKMKQQQEAEYGSESHVLSQFRYVKLIGVLQAANSGIALEGSVCGWDSQNTRHFDIHLEPRSSSRLSRARLATKCHWVNSTQAG